MIEIRAGNPPVSATDAGAAREMWSIVLHSLTAVLMYVTPFALFVPAVYIHAALRRRQRAAVLSVIGSAAMLIGAFAFGSGGAVKTDQIAMVARLVLEIGIPSLVASLLIERAVKFGTILIAATGTSAAGIVVGELLMRALYSYSPYDALIANFRQASTGTIELWRSAGMASESLTAMAQFSTAIAGGYMQSLVISISIFTFVFSLIMIPRLRAGRITGPTYLFRSLALPDWVLLLFVVSGLSPLAHGVLRTVGFNVLTVVAVLYSLQGLAVFRMLLVRSGAGLLASSALWLALIVFCIAGVGFFVLFAGGLFDSFFDFRHLNRKEVSDESNSD
ncbi:MAG: DUF2232 domain-containing protein [Thermoanaerobaculia bacterium]